MKRKHIWKCGLLLCLSAVLTVAALSGCGKQETVHLLIKTAPYPVTNGAQSEITEAYELLEKAATDFCAQYKEADVDVDVVKFDYVDETQYITDCFDTEDAADILFEGYFNMSSYIYTGRPVPLDEVVSDELKADFRDADLELGKVEGKTYMLPHHSLQNTLCYNKELFRSCGLDDYIGEKGEIVSWTMEEWQTILDTLAKKLPDLSYPMMMYAKNNQGDTHIMTLLRCFGCSFFDENNLFCLNTDEGIQALSWLQDGVERGYFPRGSQNLELADCMTLFENGQLAICIENNSTFPDMDQDVYGLVNFPDVSGQGLSTSFVTGFMVFDNGDEKKIQVAKEFLKYFYSQEELLDYEAVAIPSNQSVEERKKDQVYMLETYAKNSVTAVNFTANNPNWQGDDSSVRSVFWPHIHDLLAGDVTPEQCAEEIDRDCNAAIQKGREEGTLHD